MQPELDAIDSSKALADLPGYDRDPYAKELTTDVLSVIPEKDRPYVVLADTVCYPEGGGQPADRGSLGDVEILDDQKVDGEIRHYVDAPCELGPVRLELDWPRRFDHMQQHTAQHLLTAVALGRFGWPTTSFHIYDQVCDIELGVPELGPSDLEALEAEVMAEIRAHRPLATCWVSPQTYSQLEVRSRRLPAGHSGDIRLVEIAGIDLNTCGGTHLRATGEIEGIKLLSTESCRSGDGTRLHWVAGQRLRRRLGDHESRSAELRQLLGTRDGDMADVVRLKLDQLRDVERQLKFSRGKLAKSLAKELGQNKGLLIEAHFDAADLGFLQQVARLLGKEGFAGIAFFTGENQGERSFVVAASDRWPGSIVAGGQEVAAALDARGGGREKMFQGKTSSLKNRKLAFERLSEWARSAC